MSHGEPRPKLRSLADYIVRYDLATMLAEAHADYRNSASGGPRLLEQKDIAARFRRPRPKTPSP